MASSQWTVEVATLKTRWITHFFLPTKFSAEHVDRVLSCFVGAHPTISSKWRECSMTRSIEYQQNNYANSMSKSWLNFVQFSLLDFYIAPWKINGWNLKDTCLQRTIIFRTFIFGVHLKGYSFYTLQPTIANGDGLHCCTPHAALKFSNPNTALLTANPSQLPAICIMLVSQK